MNENVTPSYGTAEIPAQTAAGAPAETETDRPAAPDTEAPAAPRDSRSTRRKVLRRTARTVAALAVVTAFLAIADRWAVLYAENLAAEQVQKALKLRAEPEVHIDSFPFVAQIATGSLDQVQVNIPHVPAGPVSVGQVQATVDDISIVGSLPSSVEGADLGRVRGDVYLDFDDLNREVGASQVTLEPGPERNTIRAHGGLPVAGTRVDVQSRAHVRRVGDRGVALTVADTRLVVPDLLTYTPGKGGGLQLAAPAAGKMDENDFQQTTGQRLRPGRMLKGRALDALIDHPALLKPAGIDPKLVRGLRGTEKPKVAEAMEFSAELPPEVPPELHLSDLSITKRGIHAELTGDDVPVRP
ncbi:DUF2993 domain-containing protein [Streptomyces sp. NPDC058045]|uniref:LmeA family phospholipid-binding protein n=1 Tax=Streptomyces sp. NPDC058045 TaxID=3346311 RepID=UPI0036EC2A40